jgi:hypothetical protein
MYHAISGLHRGAYTAAGVAIPASDCSAPGAMSGPHMQQQALSDRKHDLHGLQIRLEPSRIATRRNSRQSLATGAPHLPARSLSSRPPHHGKRRCRLHKELPGCTACSWRTVGTHKSVRDAMEPNRCFGDRKPRISSPCRRRSAPEEPCTPCSGHPGRSSGRSG